MTQPIDLAAEAVALAARVTRAVQRDLVTAQTIEKKDKSPVTVADYAAQAVVAAVLARSVPDAALVGEETADALREPANAGVRAAVAAQVRAALGDDSIDEDAVLAWIDRGRAQPGAGSFWTLDPIDGTKGFLRGEQYAIALARIDGGLVQVAALGCPNLAGPDGSLGVVLTAARGEGAWQNGERLPAHAPVDVREARLCESVEAGHSNHDHAARIQRALGIAREPFRIDSQAKYAAVARGDAQVYLRLPTRADYREKIWDHAAGALVVEETGGTVTDVDGKPLDFGRGRTLQDNRGVIATAGGIHDLVVAATREVLG